jgi:hypothetical protein
MYNTKDYLFSLNNFADWAKYDSPANLRAVLDLLQARQWIPSRVSCDRAVRELKLHRTDGGSKAKDQALAEIKAQENFNRLIAQVRALPLQREELEEFASLSFPDLQRKYWANGGMNAWRVRYDVAVIQAGFRAPAQPAPEEPETEIELTQAEYDALSADTVRARSKSSPAFARAVERLFAGA